MIHWLQGWLDGTRRVGDELVTFDASDQLQRLVERRAEVKLDRPNASFVKRRVKYERESKATHQARRARLALTQRTAGGIALPAARLSARLTASVQMAQE